MAQIYTRRLAAHIFAGTKEVVLLGTVPPGHVWVIRDIIWDVGSTGSDLVYLYLQSREAAYVFYRQEHLGPASFHQELRVVLDEGDELHGAAAMTNTTLVVTGYDFLSPIGSIRG